MTHQFYQCEVRQTQHSAPHLKTGSRGVHFFGVIQITAQHTSPFSYILDSDKEKIQGKKDPFYSTDKCPLVTE